MEAKYKSASSEVRRDVCARLRRRFPYMKDETLEKFLRKVEDECNEFLVEQDLEHQATKSRISIFSLSAELRNSIYELALDDWNSRSTKEHDISRLDYSRPGLLAASKQIRLEALPMYYANTIRGKVVTHQELHDFSRDYGASTHRMLIGYQRQAVRRSNIRGYLQAIGIDQARMIKCFKLELEKIWAPQTELELLIRHGDMGNEEDVDKLLEALGVLDLGVPRDVWKLEKKG